MTLLQITNVVDWLVGITGLFTWALFLPQIRLLLKVKEANSVSLGLMWGSWILQILIVIQSILHQVWTLSFTMSMSVLGLSATICLIYYYRSYPGGKEKTI